jgi:hypothetical protein
VTTFDQDTARTTVDDLLHRLRTGAPITSTERSGLAELLAAVNRVRTTVVLLGSDDLPVRSGLLRTLMERFDYEFGTRPGAGGDTRGMCAVYRALRQPSQCGYPDADHQLCGCCPDTCDCPERTQT